MPRIGGVKTEKHRVVLSWQHYCDSSLGEQGINRKITFCNRWEVPLGEVLLRDYSDSGRCPWWPPPVHTLEPSHLGMLLRLSLAEDREDYGKYGIYEEARTSIRLQAAATFNGDPDLSWSLCLPGSRITSWGDPHSLPIALPFPLKCEDSFSVTLHVKDPLLGLLREAEARCVGPVKKTPAPEDVYAEITVYLVGELCIKR